MSISYYRFEEAAGNLKENITFDLKKIRLATLANEVCQSEIGELFVEGIEHDCPIALFYLNCSSESLLEFCRSKEPVVEALNDEEIDLLVQVCSCASGKAMPCIIKVDSL